jgi:type IV secretory pathway VirB10-like protein
MRRAQRLIAASVLIALSGALVGCSNGLGNFDPSDLLDFLDTKKKLPGDRKPVFPEGVPGLEQGVPKDLYKGTQQQQDQQNEAAAAATAAAPPPPPAEEPKAKRAAKSKSKANPPAPISPPPRPRLRKTRPPRHRRRRSRRRSSASAPPPRRRINRPLNRETLRSRHSRRRHHSRRRCRAVRLPADFSFPIALTRA